MATAAVNLPIHGDGTCMKCRATPPDFETLTCRTCAAPWHVPCLSSPLDPDSNPLDWPCPDCDDITGGGGVSVGGMGGDLIAKVRAIEADETLDEREKARRRQALVSGKAQNKEDGEEDDGEDAAQDKKKGVLGLLLGGCLSCSICKELPERPVTTPCGHNFCLKCFQKLVRQERVPRCANCRTTIPQKIADQPRINSALVAVIRMSKSAKSANIGSSHVYHFTRNEVRPEKAFTTDRAKRAGKANACSGQIFVTVPPDHFGPITAENDPKTHRGVVVGDSWEDRLECRQWGAHLPHVAGIAGQSDHGAQSVALSGGYEDDEDHGEWFLYTGSGGRDLSGNKRTNKEQSSDQKFEKSNQALRVSCINGYPVRVVRSWKEKRSSYAPEGGVRYDGIYRIEKCWRKAGIQGKLVCRYLFVRCDNVPAPWTSDVHGDRPRPLPAIKELNGAVDVTDRNSSPSWDYDETNGWNWTKLPPVSKKPVRTGDANEQKMTKEAIVTAQRISVKEQLLKEFKCLICHKVMASPVSTPCGHNFCKMCLLGSYSDLSFVRERKSSGGRTLRAQKIVKKCPSCPTDICEFLQQPQVNRELMELIESIKHECEEEKKLHDKGEKCDGEGNSNENISDSADDNKFSEEAEEDLEDAKENIASKRGAANGTLHPKKRRKMGDAANADEDGNDSPSSPLNISVEDNGSE